MDLSQQELPLTVFFTKGSKDARSRAFKNDGLAEDSQSAARSSKRSRSNVRCSTTSALSASVGRSKPRQTTQQLLTPVASARKRVRGGRVEGLPGKTRHTSTGVSLSSTGQNPTLSSENDLMQLGFEPLPSNSTNSSRTGTEDAVPISPFTPAASSADQRKAIKPIDIEFSLGTRLSNHTEIGLATPQTSSRGMAGPVHGINGDHSPLSRPDRHAPSKLSQVSPGEPSLGVSYAVLPLARLTSSPVGPSCSDPFHAPEKDSVSVPRGGASVLPKQYIIRSETLDDQFSDGHLVPMIPVPSSQSQYLLHLDATPKRKRYSQHIDHVISSQTQEERELTLSVSHKPPASVLSVAISPGKHALCGSALNCSGRKSRRVCTFGSTFVGSPTDSSASLSHSFATKKASDELSPRLMNPSRRKRSISCHSPSRKTKARRVYARHDSIENIPPVHIEDSLTESESDSNIIQVACHSPVSRDPCPPVRCRSPLECLPEDDSATEAESDTDILHCVAGISKRQPCEHRVKAPKEDTPPTISPLVSPTRPRIATAPPTMSFTQFSMLESGGLGVPGLCASYPSTMEQPQTRSESFPSVVRDFIRMFPGDESYPQDFPESLRI